MIRAIIALAAALCISLVINFTQYRSHLIDEVRAPLVAAIESARETERQNAAIDAARVEDAATIAALREEIAAREVRTITVYRDRVRELPAAECAPGHARVEAWNTIATEEP